MGKSYQRGLKFLKSSKLENSEKSKRLRTKRIAKNFSENFAKISQFFADHQGARAGAAEGAPTAGGQRQVAARVRAAGQRVPPVAGGHAGGDDGGQRILRWVG